MRILALLALGGALTPLSLSQSILYTFDGDYPNLQFGRSISGAGDVNGDGYHDLIVGIPRDDPNGFHSGSARVYSGVDGSVLYTLDGNSPYDDFGWSVSGAGDVNGDGFDDVIVGAPGDDSGSGSGTAAIFSGKSGSMLYIFDGDSPIDRFGVVVSGAGDVNGDGFGDVIVGAPYDDNTGMNSGSARVLSGLDGSVLYTFDGGSPGDQWGGSVDGAGDVNADGFDDLIVGAMYASNAGSDSGSALVFSGLDGSRLYTFDGALPYDYLGKAVSSAGDVNADGHADLLVSMALDIKLGKGAGRARVFSGQDGSILYDFDGDSGYDGLGASISELGDVNGDGHADLLVGIPGADNNRSNSGSARVFSGLDGSILYTFDGDSEDDWFGLPVSGAGDVDGDGYPDLIVGASGDDNNGSNSASVRVFSGKRTVIGTNYCGPAVPNSTGLPGVILALGSVTASENQIWLQAVDLPRNKFGYFIASQTQGFVPGPGNSKGNLCLSGEIARFRSPVQKSSRGGYFSIQVDLTSIPTSPPHFVLAGETWNFQAWYRDEKPNQPSNFTDGVSVLFQ